MPRQSICKEVWTQALDPDILDPGSGADLRAKKLKVAERLPVRVR